MIDISYADLFSLKGKRALVTGGAGILGTEFCRGLAASGADVAVADLNGEGAQALAEELKATYGVNAVGIGMDVADPASVEAGVARATQELGNLTVLLNNAAGKSDDLDAFFAPFEEYSLDQWRKIMAVNIDGMFLVAQAVGKRMVEAGTGGSVVQTASIYGVMAPDKRIYEGSFYLNRQINTPAVYAASKAAVVGLTTYLAAYWADKGIRVNTLTPGGVASGQNETFKQRYGARIPMGRMAERGEMVGAVVYLASDAASYVTGQNLMVDGGLSAW
ncbi:MAG: SDR family oxidoreductase [Nitrospinae bacterium]|nr:SDR family oxidoreductase [Nitrospinota bacterium]